VTVEPTRAAVERVQALARAALALEAGATGGPPTGVHVDPDDLVAAAVRHRVVDLLFARRDGLALAAELGSDHLAALGAVHAETRRKVALQLLELARLLDLFARAEIPVLVLKGPALAIQSAGDAAARGYGDIDLFVAPGSVEASHLLLAEHGWEPRRFGSAAPGSWAWRHLISTFNEVAFDGRSSTVDLHWRLDPNPDVLPDFDESWANRVEVDTGVVRVPTLDPATAFRHTCQHAAKDDWRWLRSVVDVHRLARLPEVRALLTGGGARSPGSEHVAASLAVADRLIGLPADLPTTVVAHARSHRSQVRRAVRMQSRAAQAERPMPMAQSMRDLRYRLVASRTPRSILGAVSATAMPAPSVEGLTDRSAWTAVPKLAVRRISWLVSRSVRWLAGVRVGGTVTEDGAPPRRWSLRS
jgi:hypothetical protein